MRCFVYIHCTAGVRLFTLLCRSARSFNTAETHSTIRFGASAKTIKNKAKVNVTRSLHEVIDALETANKTITRQAKVIAGLQATIEQYRAILRQNGLPDTVTLPDLTQLGKAASASALPALSPMDSPMSTSSAATKDSTGGKAVAAASSPGGTKIPTRTGTGTRPGSSHRSSLIATRPGAASGTPASRTTIGGTPSRPGSASKAAPA